VLGQPWDLALHSEGEQDLCHGPGQLGQRRQELHPHGPFDKLTAVMGKAEVDAAREAKRIAETPDGCGFVLLTEAPKPTRPATREQTPPTSRR